MSTPIKPPNLCLAPWTHTYLSPQTERRLCCASREQPQSFEQYIDRGPGDGKYTPSPLETYWNSERMRAVRLKMLDNQVPEECEVCDQKLLNTNVYRDYFNQLFAHKWPEIPASTDATGATTMQPVSWDYRFSNLCNFKCRMCGDMLSSAWEAEQRINNMIDWTNPKNGWMRPEIKEQITQFQDSIIEKEFSDAVEDHRIEEIYWVGGEPLMYEQHWRYMQRIIELGDGPKLYARYNTNLSRTQYRGTDLFKDILINVRDWQICASLDGTGATGEYIRTGLDYLLWKKNFEQARSIVRDRRQLRIDFTLTLPGMTELVNITQLAKELDVDILAKLIFSFNDDVFMSPLSLPRSLLKPWISDVIGCVDAAIAELLEQLLKRETMEEQFPDTYLDGLQRGKRRILELERIRPSETTMESILAARPDVLAWYLQIDA